jgi:hypothetical protein
MQEPNQMALKPEIESLAKTLGFIESLTNNVAVTTEILGALGLNHLNELGKKAKPKMPNGKFKEMENAFNPVAEEILGPDGKMDKMLWSVLFHVLEKCNGVIRSAVEHKIKELDPTGKYTAEIKTQSEKYIKLQKTDKKAFEENETKVKDSEGKDAEVEKLLMTDKSKVASLYITEQFLTVLWHNFKIVSGEIGEIIVECVDKAITEYANAHPDEAAKINLCKIPIEMLLKLAIGKAAESGLKDLLHTIESHIKTAEAKLDPNKTIKVELAEKGWFELKYIDSAEAKELETGSCFGRASVRIWEKLSKCCCPRANDNDKDEKDAHKETSPQANTPEKPSDVVKAVTANSTEIGTEHHDSEHTVKIVGDADLAAVSA